jgi:hypothetical protein
MTVAFVFIRMASRAGNLDIQVGWTNIRSLAGKLVSAKDMAFPAC